MQKNAFPDRDPSSKTKNYGKWFMRSLPNTGSWILGGVNVSGTFINAKGLRINVVDMSPA